MRIVARSAFLAALFFAASSIGPSRASAQDSWTFERQAEALIAQGINQERAQFAPGAPQFNFNPVLNGIAEARSEDMAHGAAFSHDDTQGRFIARGMIQAHFGPYGRFGENILKIDGLNSASALWFARQAVIGWMNSPGHRANILDASYDSSGIGVAVVGDHVYATEVFRGPWRRLNS